MSVRAKYSLVFLFLALFAHVSIMDLFFVSYSGPVFLWEENLAIRTVVVHIICALLSALSYKLFAYIRKDAVKGRIVLSDKVLIICSIALVFSIIFTISQ